MKTGRLMALMLSLVLVMALAVACGGNEPKPAPTAPAGVTASELQSAMTAAIEAAASSAPTGVTADQMTAAVNAAVSAAVAGIEPAEGVSAAEISKLVGEAVKAQVQPGASAAEIAALVESAVKAAEAAREPGVTVDQLAKAVEDAVSEAVEPVVVERTVVVKIPFEVVVEKEMPSAPGLTADPQSTQAYRWPRFLPDFTPASFQEAPMLAKRVALGELPPVEQRLPKNPKVLEPADSIGEYGGTMYSGFGGPTDKWGVGRLMRSGEPMLYWDTGQSILQPHLAESYTSNDDMTEFTFTLREGLRWSDGAPLTTADVMFWYTYMLSNDDLVLSKPGWATWGGELLKYEAIDDLTFKVTSAAPHGIFPQLMASCCGVAGPYIMGQAGLGGYAPAHYLKQFHPDFVGLDKANAMAEEAGFDGWRSYFLDRSYASRNPDLPLTTAWIVKQPIMGSEFVLERNPYYWEVDTAGNQLPYIDRILLTSTGGELEVLNLRAIAGEYTFQAMGIDLSKLPVFLENAERGNYRVQFLREPAYGPANLFFNEGFQGDPELTTFLQSVDFRKALSMATDGDQVNEAFFVGVGTSKGLCSAFPDPDNPGKYIGEDHTVVNLDRTSGRFWGKQVQNGAYGRSRLSTIW